MDTKALTDALGILPNAVLASLLSLFIGLTYKSVKKLAMNMYVEILTSNATIKDKLEKISKDIDTLQEETHDLKMQIKTLVTIEKHFEHKTSISKDVSEIRERVARMEGVTY